MITIVTDSSAHMTRAECQELGVEMISMTYSVDAQATLREGFEGENPGCEALIRDNMEKMRTSQATYLDFLERFQALTQNPEDQVLCLAMSSRLSGTYGNACTAARDLGNGRVWVVDSLTTSGGLFLLVREARRLLDAGKSPEETAAALEALRGGVRITFTVDDIGPLRRSGRLGGVRLSISTILNIRPVLACVDGAIVATGTVRGRGEQLRVLLSTLPEGNVPCVVEHFDAQARAEELSGLIEAAGHPVIRHTIGPVLGIHLGMGCMGVCFMT